MLAWRYTFCPPRVSRDFATNLLLTIQLRSSSTLKLHFSVWCGSSLEKRYSKSNVLLRLLHLLSLYHCSVYEPLSAVKVSVNIVQDESKPVNISHVCRHHNILHSSNVQSVWSLRNAKCDMSRTYVKKKEVKVSLLAAKGSEGWMTKEMGSGEERGRVAGREGEREREYSVICCTTEPHSRHRRNSR